MSKIIFKKDIVEKNINHIKKLFCNFKNVSFNFPVKTCTNQDILNLFNLHGFGFDVSNKNEFDLVKKFNAFVSCSGPCVLDMEKIQGVQILYFNSISDLVATNLTDSQKGLRINFNGQLGFVKSHFGETDFCKKDFLKVKHIHFHISDKKTKRTLRRVMKILKKRIRNCKNLETLNVGGGLESLDDKTLVWYVGCLRKMLKPSQKLILECGDLWFKDAGRLTAKIAEVKDFGKGKILAFLPISKDCNLKWSNPIFVEEEKTKRKYKVIFCGVTCYEKDIIATAKLSEKPIKGQIVEFSNISPYSAEWNTSFNGVEKIEVEYV